MNTKNLDAALKALTAELGAEVADEDVPAYLDRIAEVVTAAQALRATHKRVINRLASQRSRANKAKELEAMKARIAELEGGAK
jgi:hypothetical protein